MDTDILYILATVSGGMIGAGAAYVFCNLRRDLELENSVSRIEKKTAELRAEEVSLLKENTELRAENDRLQKKKNELWDEKISLQKENTELHRDRTRLLDRINILEKPAPKCQRRLLTRPQLAKIMGVSNSTVTRWQKAGCPSVDGELIVAGERTGETIRRYWFPDVIDWLKSGRQPSQTTSQTTPAV